MPDGIHNEMAEVFVTLKNDDFKYLVEVRTPLALASLMAKRKQKF
jgi:hypothetical protein